MKKTFTFHTRSRLWILCAAVCMVWAVPLHAQTRRISLNLKNATIEQAVIALQQQGYSLLGQGRRCGHEGSCEHPCPERRAAGGCRPYFCRAGRELYHQRQKHSDYESPVSAFVRRLVAGISRNRAGERPERTARSSVSPC